jgi:hypothetical protein
VRVLTKTEVPAFLAEHRFSVIHCDAQWDGYRLIVERNIKEIEANTPDVGFGYVDVDCDIDFAREANLLNVPTVIYYRGNNLIAAVIGQMQDIRGNIAKLRSGEAINRSNSVSRL